MVPISVSISCTHPHAAVNQKLLETHWLTWFHFFQVWRTQSKRDSLIRNHKLLNPTLLVWKMQTPQSKKLVRRKSETEKLQILSSLFATRKINPYWNTFLICVQQQYKDEQKEIVLMCTIWMVSRREITANNPFKLIQVLRVVGWSN